MATLYNPAVVKDNLVLCLDAANTRSYPGSGTTWSDLSGNSRNATITGAVSYTSGNAAYFSGFGNGTYISLSNSGLVPRTNDFTYSCWIYFNAVDSTDTIFENGSWPDCLLFRYETNLFTVYAENALRGNISWTAVTGAWQNIVLVRSSNTVSCYINNVLTGTPFTMNLDIDLANTNLFLMRSQHASDQQTNGRLSTFSIYNTALTTSQITQNFNALRGRYGI